MEKKQNQSDRAENVVDDVSPVHAAEKGVNNFQTGADDQGDGKHG